MNPSHATKTTQFKVGLFTLLGLFLIGGVSIYVNHRPFWWRPCQLVKINVEDATGLKTKSPIRSLGLEIGFLRSVELTETHVTLGICITAPVEILPATRAYIRGEGFLGDKFVELKPVRYVGTAMDGGTADTGGDTGSQPAQSAPHSALSIPALLGISTAEAADAVPANTPPSNGASVNTVPANQGAAPGTVAPGTAGAATAGSTDDTVNAGAAGNAVGTTAATGGSNTRSSRGGREIPVGENSQDIQQLVNRVDSLVNEMTGLTQNLRQGLNPEEMRQTMRQLNKTLENASRTLSPEGGLNQTAQRTLAKLEDAIEQLRDMMTRVNRGEGSVGMLLNDPSYAQQIREALDNLNRLLNKAGHLRLVVDVGAQELVGYGGGRGYFELGIWPSSDRYYRLGIAVDPRGKLTITQTTTIAGGQTTQTETQQNEINAFLLTGMLGKTFFYGRLDLSAGVQYGDGTASAMVNLGPPGQVDEFAIRDDLYSLSNNRGVADRVTGYIHPVSYFKDVYMDVGIEDFREVNDKINYFYGVGLRFDDEDIKFLLSLK
jgi:phospholipid/cholesterol/gamma-HCH transport system substrate-binding protein